MSDKCFCGHTEEEHYYEGFTKLGVLWYESWCTKCDCLDYEKPAGVV